jgi:hypothetical protein
MGAHNAGTLSRGTVVFSRARLKGERDGLPELHYKDFRLSPFAQASTLGNCRFTVMSIKLGPTELREEVKSALQFVWVTKHPGNQMDLTMVCSQRSPSLAWPGLSNHHD